MSEDFYRKQFHPTDFPRVGDAVHLNLQRHMREKAEEQARATDERLAEALKEAHDAKDRVFDQYIADQIYTAPAPSWDAEDADPWHDIHSAMHAVDGKGFFAGSSRPRNGVYLITDL